MQLWICGFPQHFRQHTGQALLGREIPSGDPHENDTLQLIFPELMFRLHMNFLGSCNSSSHVCLAPFKSLSRNSDQFRPHTSDTLLLNTCQQSESLTHSTVIVVIKITTSITNIRNHLRLPRISSSPALAAHFGGSNFFLLLHEDQSNHAISLKCLKR